MSTTIIPGPNVFTAVSGSLFSSPINWSRGYVPTGSDAAVINDNCTIDVSRTVGSLVVMPQVTASISGSITLQVRDVINCLGHISCSGAPNIISFAKKNIINSLSPASSSFLYTGSASQNVPGGPYFDLTIYGTGIKTVTSNTTVNRNLEIGQGSGANIFGFLELGPYDISVYGSTVVGANAYGVLSKSKFGNLLFVGSFANGNRTAAIRFSDGNPNVEFRSGIITINSNPASDTIQSGTGTWTFTSPTQTLQGWANIFPLNLDANIIISSSATLNIFGGYNISNSINGAGPSSNLVMLANSALTFTTPKALLNSMLSGSFNFTSSSNIIGIGGNYTATIPARFNTFRDLSISGTGTKTLGTSSFILGDLTVGRDARLDISSFNLIVSGTTTINAVGTTAYLIKSGPGNVTFVGPLATAYGGLNFSSGSPNVELRNGWIPSYNTEFYSGTGSYLFATGSNQIIGQSGYGNTLQFNGPLIVGSNVTLSLNSGQTVIINHPLGLNGQDATSRFINSSSLYLYTSRSIMETGSFDYLSNAYSEIGYMFNGNYTLPYTVYQGLRIDGSGSKYPSGNTYISQSYYGANRGNFELGNYDLIISGSTTFSTDQEFETGSITKSGPGTVIFGGLVLSGYRSYTVDFSVGNPTVEVRGGMQLNSQDRFRFKAGTGSWYFTTNNQYFGNTVYGGEYIFSGSFIVGNDITLAYNGSNYNLFILGILNGSNSNSKFSMSGSNVNTVYYYNSQIPMQVGILDVTGSATTSTFIYASGSQNVKGGVYRNLTFLNGVKTLQGNVSVLGTFSTGSGATSASINLNGFTLTNP